MREQQQGSCHCYSLHHQSARHNNNTPRNNPQLFGVKSHYSGTEDADKYNFVV